METMKAEAVVAAPPALKPAHVQYLVRTLQYDMSGRNIEQYLNQAVVEGWMLDSISGIGHGPAMAVIVVCTKGLR
jgi:hypothetical protein